MSIILDGLGSKQPLLDGFGATVGEGGVNIAAVVFLETEVLLATVEAHSEIQRSRGRVGRYQIYETAEQLRIKEIETDDEEVLELVSSLFMEVIA